MSVPTGPQPDSGARAHRVVVTGGTGTLGRHVLAQIAAWQNTEVLALVRRPPPASGRGGGLRYQQVDFESREALAEAIASFRPTSIVHCAAIGMQQPRPRLRELVRVNVDLSLLLCEVAATVPGCHLVFVSSGLAYRDQGRPLCEDDPVESQHPYGASKAAADMLVRTAAAELQLPLTVVRPFSFSGAGDTGSRLFPALLQAAAEHSPFKLSPGDQVRDHCAVEDIAAGIALVVARRRATDPKTEVFNFGSGSSLSLRDLIEGVVRELELEVTLKFRARDYAPFEPKFLVADIARARNLLSWQPQTNFAYAIWQLAHELCPSLKLNQPRRSL